MSTFEIANVLSPLFLADIELIDATDRLRPVDAAHAEFIAASISEGGLISPIVVRVHPSGNGLKLVVGGHRLRAGQILGWEQIPATLIEATDDEARLIEIDENLARRELTALERAEFLRERKRAYEAAHPETATGKAKKPKKGDDRAKLANMATFARFSKDAAKVTGISERTVQRACELAASLSPKAVALIRGTKLADNQAQLQALAALEPADQVTVAGLIAAKAASNVAKARVIAGFVPEGGVVRAVETQLMKLEPIVARLSLAEAQTLSGMVAARIASLTPAKPKKGSAA